MHSTVSRCLLVAALVILAASARAETQAAACDGSDPQSIPLTDRAAAIAQFERMPQSCLRAIVRQCTAAAGEAMLDAATANACSFGYEALLKKGFGGDFQAMLAWWRGEQVASR